MTIYRSIFKRSVSVNSLSSVVRRSLFYHTYYIKCFLSNILHWRISIQTLVGILSIILWRFRSLILTKTAGSYYAIIVALLLLLCYSYCLLYKCLLLKPVTRKGIAYAITLRQNKILLKSLVKIHVMDSSLNHFKKFL